MKKNTLLYRLKQFLTKPENRPVLITAAAALLPAAVWFFLDFIFPLPLYRLQDDYSVLHITQENRLLRLSLSPSGMYRIKTPLSDLPEFIKRGAVEYEDKMFYFHPGINPFAVARAAFLNVTNMRVVSGGSTITMQLAKLLEPRKRTLGAKIIEAFRNKDIEKARAIQKNANEIISIMLATGSPVSGGKSMMKICGLDCGPCREPLGNLTDKQYEKLKEDLEKSNFFDLIEEARSHKADLSIKG